MAKYYRFIVTPIAEIMEETALASCGVASGIESYAISDYIFQTLFLKMTGSMEQKMKCICWDMATNDPEFRYKYLENIGKYGGGSSYDSKNFVYKHLIQQIQKEEENFNPIFFLKHTEIHSMALSAVVNAFNGSKVSTWNQQHFDSFEDSFRDILTSGFGDTNLLNTPWIEVYKNLYDHRNRCAHNTPSYQQNLPTLKQLACKENKYENYYFRFGLLLLIDYVFISLYEEYYKQLSIISLSWK